MPLSAARICPISGKGLGVIATENIKPGTLIIKEQPILSLKLDVAGDLQGKIDPLSGQFRCSDLELKLDGLSEKELSQFQSLTDSFTKLDATAGVKSDFGIIKTNSFSVSINDETRLVLFPKIARINHSCVPNCHHYWSNRTKSFLIRATEYIEKGDEITISYMSPLQRSEFHEKESRRRILQTEFGFLCLCQLCSMSDHYENDCKRRRILEIEEQWSELGNQPDQALQLAEEQLRYCEDLCFQAGLLAYVSLHYVEASSLLITKFRDTPDAKIIRKKCLVHATKAKAYGKVAYGDHSEELGIFKEVQKFCQESTDEEMLVNIQAAIAKLRDIDS